jgi:hypothetical protein
LKTTLKESKSHVMAAVSDISPAIRVSSKIHGGKQQGIVFGEGVDRSRSCLAVK